MHGAVWSIYSLSVSLEDTRPLGNKRVTSCGSIPQDLYWLCTGLMMDVVCPSYIVRGESKGVEAFSSCHTLELLTKCLKWNVQWNVCRWCCHFSLGWGCRLLTSSSSVHPPSMEEPVFVISWNQSFLRKTNGSLLPFEHPGDDKLTGRVMMSRMYPCPLVYLLSGLTVGEQLWIGWNGALIGFLYFHTREYKWARKGLHAVALSDSLFFPPSSILFLAQWEFFSMRPAGA